MASAWLALASPTLADSSEATPATRPAFAAGELRWRELAATMTKLVVARERPFAEHCDSGGGSDCKASDRFLSFDSGHANSTSTFAGLTCAHHQKLAMYGSVAADLGSVSLASATGALRIAADKHW